MGITVSGKLNRPANERVTPSGDSTFFVSIGKKERDFKANADVWVNYQAALFAKQGPQANFYRDVLQQGAIITVSGSGLLPRIWGDNSDKVSLSIQDSKLEFSFGDNQGQSAQQSPAPQAPNQFPPGYGQQQPQQSSQSPAAGGFDDFDDDTPFSNYQLKVII